MQQLPFTIPSTLDDVAVLSVAIAALLSQNFEKPPYPAWRHVLLDIGKKAGGLAQLFAGLHPNPPGLCRPPSPSPQTSLPHPPHQRRQAPHNPSPTTPHNTQSPQTSRTAAVLAFPFFLIYCFRSLSKKPKRLNVIYGLVYCSCESVFEGFLVYEGGYGEFRLLEYLRWFLKVTMPGADLEVHKHFPPSDLIPHLSLPPTATTFPN